MLVTTNHHPDTLATRAHWKEFAAHTTGPASRRQSSSTSAHAATANAVRLHLSDQQDYYSLSPRRRHHSIKLALTCSAHFPPFRLEIGGLCATDYLTRYSETKALPKATAVEIAQFFATSIVLRHGAPAVIITDRGTAFTAEMLQEVLRLSGTEHRKTTGYHPQTNGLTERLSKTIADMLSMYVAVDHKNWDDILPYVTFAYNTAVQESTGFTPFRLVHGREVTTMLDAMLLPNNLSMFNTDAALFAQRAEEARQLARCRIQARQTADAHRYNLTHREVTFQPGDEVWVWTPIRQRGHSEKLLRRYFGPYKVLRRLSDVTYEVLPEGTSRRSRRFPLSDVVHVSRLKT